MLTDFCNTSSQFKKILDTSQLRKYIYIDMHFVKPLKESMTMINKKVGEQEKQEGNKRYTVHCDWLPGSHPND